MKFSTCVFSLCVLVASASAACSCSSSDQACMDKCGKLNMTNLF